MKAHHCATAPQRAVTAVFFQLMSVAVTIHARCVMRIVQTRHPLQIHVQLHISASIGLGQGMQFQRIMMDARAGSQLLSGVVYAGTSLQPWDCRPSNADYDNNQC